MNLVLCLQRPLVDHGDPSSSGGTSGLHHTSSGLLQQHSKAHSPRHETSPHSPSRAGLGPTAAAAADVAVAVSPDGPKQRLSWRHVLSEAWQSILALFLVYCVTLSLFPGVLAEDLKVGMHCTSALVAMLPSLTLCMCAVCACARALG
jgi:hypothetical protein